jgi:hypothetical protein
LSSGQIQAQEESHGKSKEPWPPTAVPGMPGLYGLEGDGKELNKEKRIDVELG